MKKFWKNLCVTSMAVVSAFGIAGCGDDDANIKYDLDGDGVETNWELPFDKLQATKRPSLEANKDIVEINSLEEFKAISDKSGEFTIFRLNQNIDCGGQEISINLGQNVLLGNGKTISNFKLGSFALAEDNTNKAMCVIYGGNGVYDLNLHMGIQTIALTEKNIGDHSAITSIIGAINIDNVHVKGKLVVQKKTAGNGANIDISLLASDKNAVENKEEDRENLRISNSTVTGIIDFKDEISGSTITRVGGIAPYLNNSTNCTCTDEAVCDHGSIIRNCNATVDIKGITSCDFISGLIAGELGKEERTKNYGIISSCSTSGSISFGLQGGGEDISLGGIVGKVHALACVKNCKTDATITNLANDTSTITSYPNIVVGGIAGYSNGVIEYAVSDGKINLSNQYNVTTGGIAGITDGAVFTNIISRGSILLTNIDRVQTAEMVALVDGGLIKNAIIATTITINNAEIVSERVDVGMLMNIVPEETSSEKDVYTAYNSPSISGVFLCGESKVTVKGEDINAKKVSYEKGLRVGESNSFKYIVNPESIDDEAKYSTRTPILFNNIFYLKGGYKLTIYNASEENKEELLDIEYGPSVSEIPLVSMKQVSFFTQKLGFKTGGNHKELDMAGFDIASMKFNLENNPNTSYFDIDNQNGEYRYFDHYINDETFANNTSDELFSLLKYLMANKQLLDGEGTYVTPLIISDKYLESATPQNQGSSDNSGEPSTVDEDENNSSQGGDTSSSVIAEYRKDQLFVEKVIQPLIEKMHKINTNEPIIVNSIKYLNKEWLDVANEEEYKANQSEDNTIRYVKISFVDDKTYIFTFDVKEMSEGQKSAYLVLLKYQRL